ncbi:hypothetical protein EYF80_007253 [Liparis tanakae]|uniref:Uncharacterized protein n=1 Tax=Liparis tanakae TaxID=230148 RepID=A0A4Z2IY53_9TELE|nr:hypothetical protein EYF80_007253 [Liparis tanakae]
MTFIKGSLKNWLMKACFATFMMDSGDTQQAALYNRCVTIGAEWRGKFRHSDTFNLAEKLSFEGRGALLIKNTMTFSAAAEERATSVKKERSYFQMEEAAVFSKL